MLTQSEEEAVIRKAVAAGLLTRGDSELTTPPWDSIQEQPVFSVRIDYLVKLGSLSAETAHALVREVQLEAAGATLAPPTELTLDALAAKPALAETLDPTSNEAKALLAASDNSFVLSQTVNNAPRGSSSSTANSMLRFPVEHWDRYEFIKLLGQGGMGSVYQARDRQLGRIVALKFIRSGDPQMTARFLQEARTQSRCDHPGICKVFDVGEIDGKAYIVMQFVDGQPLHQAVKQMGVLEKVQIIKDTAEALHVAHELGIIHRDVKPANLMLERFIDAEGLVRNRPVIMDFGLAREPTDGKGLTESGAIMGTDQRKSFPRRQGLS